MLVKLIESVVCVCKIDEIIYDSKIIDTELTAIVVIVPR
jgi:hypothetical protein